MRAPTIAARALLAFLARAGASARAEFGVLYVEPGRGWLRVDASRVGVYAGLASGSRSRRPSRSSGDSPVCRRRSRRECPRSRTAA